LVRPLPAVEPPEPERIAELASEQGAERIVVGLPITLGGEEGDQARLSRAFAAELEGLIDLPVEMYDERLTTTMAERSARAGAEAHPDSLAAAHLLESYLAARGGGDLSERQDWFADTEGNLRSADDALKPPTDEFGRDDPASIERERRRRERQARRKKSKRASSDGGGPRPRRANAKQAPPAEVAAGATKNPPEQPAKGARPPRPGNYRRRRIVALALTLIGLLLAWFLVALFQPFKGDGEGQVIVNIPEGATAGEIADILTENDVVSNGTLFEIRLRLAGKEGDVQAGRYVLAGNMSYGAAIDELTSSGGKVTLTLPEGLPRAQMAPIISAVGVSGDYVAATQSFQGFDPARYGATDLPSLEGFLFPATYQLDPGSDVNVLIAEQLEAFRQNIAQVDLSYAKKKNLTPYDVLTIASMVDREVAVGKERPLVAAVIYNRLRRGMPLAIDATTRYEFNNYEQPITQSQLDSPSAYNTRTHMGLPPTPIGNPGLDAIEAAAHPAKVNYLFYVVRPGSCEHNFTASEAEFEQFNAQYQQALQEQGGSPTQC
jgi:peptidoglycan lytic transglycosylase G